MLIDEDELKEKFRIFPNAFRHSSNMLRDLSDLNDKKQRLTTKIACLKKIESRKKSSLFNKTSIIEEFRNYNGYHVISKDLQKLLSRRRNFLFSDQTCKQSTSSFETA